MGNGFRNIFQYADFLFIPSKTYDCYASYFIINQEKKRQILNFESLIKDDARYLIKFPNDYEAEIKDSQNKTITSGSLIAPGNYYYVSTKHSY